MIAYIFWHWPERLDGYEAALAEFHRRLAGAGLPGLRATATYRVSGLPWIGAAEGYEDWYVVGDFSDLGPLNEGAVGPEVRPYHDRPAAMTAGAAGGLYGLRTGAIDLRQAVVTWISKPHGMAYGDFYAGLPAAAALLRRQMVLGPAPEFCAFGELPDGIVSRRELIFAS